jgi:hypothetical protein
MIDGLLPYYNLMAAAWVLCWAIWGAVSIARGRHRSIYFVMVVHFVFMALPLALDVIVGRPAYRNWPGFSAASSDPMTEVIYGMYIAACPLIWWYFGRVRGGASVMARNPLRLTDVSRLARRMQPLLTVLLLGPLLLLPLAPDPSVYRDYAAVVRTRFDLDAASFHNSLSLAALLCVLSAQGILLARKRTALPAVVLGPFVVLAVWLHGKRSIVILALAAILIALWQKRVLRGWRLGGVATLALVSYALFSQAYQVAFRSYDQIDSTQAYESTRIDYSRDNVVKLSIYSELHPEVGRILEYRLQSVLFYATIFIPRDLWPDKPWPYAVYSTAAAMKIPRQFIGWGVTTSCLEEAIANFGWLGMLVGPLTLALICGYGDTPGDPVLRLFTALVCCLALILQLAAWYVLALCWAVVMIRGRKRARLYRRSTGRRIMLVPVFQAASPTATDTRGSDRAFGAASGGGQ